MKDYLLRIFQKDLTIPRWLIFLIDILICGGSYVFATLLRFNFFIEDQIAVYYFSALPVVLFVRVIFLLLFRTYAGIIWHTSFQDAIRVFYTVALSSLTIFFVNVAYTKLKIGEGSLIPLSIIIIDFFGTTLLMSFFRMGVKLIYLRLSKVKSQVTVNYAIFGAGETGIVVKRKLDEFGKGRMVVAAFFDDSKKQIGKYIDGVNIYDGQSELASVLVAENIKHLIITPQEISKLRKQQIIEVCLKLNVYISNVPPVDKWINGELSFNQIKTVKIDDLIYRDEIVLDKSGIARTLQNKTVLVTGAAGSIGSEIVRQILSYANPKKLILVDKSEENLFELEGELQSTFKAKSAITEILIADITSVPRMRYIFRTHRPDIVYHSAAYKHVPLMESNVSEAIRVNVMGTKIISDLAVEFHTDKFVLISTDKAVNPTNVMGASKRIAEIYIQSLDQNKADDNSTKTTSFITTRFGNVIGSSGSVIPKFRKQIDDGGPVTVTHPEVTRFFMTVPEACQLVLEASNMGNGGEIYIFEMGNSIRILDIAKRMIQLSGLKLGEDIQIIFTGLRPGEKLKEELLSDRENTIPTYHPKIMIAKVRHYDYHWVNHEIAELIQIYESQNNLNIVRKMKEIVPEFLSKNSIYEVLDSHPEIREQAMKHSHVQ